MRSIKWSGPAAGMVLGVAFAGAAAAAEQVYVQKPSLVVREGKGKVYKEVATVERGAPLTVLERDGGWVRVRTAGGGEGWVFEGSVTAKKVGKGLGDALGANAAAGDASAGPAGKGLEPEAVAYADTKNLDRRPLDRMIAASKAVDPAEWERFVEEGKVGPAKRRD